MYKKKANQSQLSYIKKYDIQCKKRKEEKEKTTYV